MALGRGLGSLISAGTGESHVSEEIENKNSLIMVSTDHLKPNPEQPRVHFDEEKLQELSDSIKARGVIEPLLVKKTDNGYMIVAGERRWRAATMAGLDEVPVICEDFTDEEILEISIIENIQREDLNVIEQARGYKTLIEKFGYTHEELAKKLGVSRTSITNILRILKLPESIQSMILEDVLSYTCARALIGLESESQQLEFAQKIIDEELNVRDVENLIRKIKTPKETKQQVIKKSDPYLQDIEQRLSQKIDAKVEIKSRKNKGKIEISYSSLEHLNIILDLLGLKQE